MEYSQGDLQYLAGFMDADGTFVFQKGSANSFRVAVTAWNSDLVLLENLQSVFGGVLDQDVSNRKKDHGRKVMFYIRFHYKELLLILPQLIPFLRSKRQQAEICLRYLTEAAQVSNFGRQRPDLIPMFAAMAVECSELNHRGYDCG